MTDDVIEGMPVGGFDCLTDHHVYGSPYVEPPMWICRHCGRVRNDDLRNHDGMLIPIRQEPIIVRDDQFREVATHILFPTGAKSTSQVLRNGDYTFLLRTSTERWYAHGLVTFVDPRVRQIILDNTSLKTVHTTQLLRKALKR